MTQYDIILCICIPGTRTVAYCSWRRTEAHTEEHLCESPPTILYVYWRHFYEALILTFYTNEWLSHCYCATAPPVAWSLTLTYYYHPIKQRSHQWSILPNNNQQQQNRLVWYPSLLFCISVSQLRCSINRHGRIRKLFRVAKKWNLLGVFINSAGASILTQ